MDSAPSPVMGWTDSARSTDGHLVNMADVEPEEVHWLWPARIPAGKVTILDGDPGLGKSTITLDVAARVTRGDPMPDGSRPYFEGPQEALLLTAEDGLADTIRPRLDAANAVPELVSVLRSVPTEDGKGRPPTVEDLHDIDDALRETNARLLVIDPLVAFLPDGVNTYRDKQIRRALAPLAELAERTGAAIVAIRHLTKANGGKAIYRGGGSIGIIGAARAGLVVAPDPEDETERRRILAATKANLSEKPPALAYHLEGADGAVRVVWEGQSGHTANELMEQLDADERTARQEAAEFLREELRQGERPSSELRSAAKRAGLNWRTVKRAKRDLGVESERRGFGSDGRWYWTLPIEGQGPCPPKGDSDLSFYEKGQATQGDSEVGESIGGQTKNVSPLGQDSDVEGGRSDDGPDDLQTDLGSSLGGA